MERRYPIAWDCATDEIREATYNGMAEDLGATWAEIERLTAENERLRAALLWIDTFDPETTAAAEKKFGFSLVQQAAP